MFLVPPSGAIEKNFLNRPRFLQHPDNLIAP
jgi:hypothetical protein